MNILTCLQIDISYFLHKNNHQAQGGLGTCLVHHRYRIDIYKQISTRCHNTDVSAPSELHRCTPYLQKFNLLSCSCGQQNCSAADTADWAAAAASNNFQVSLHLYRSWNLQPTHTRDTGPLVWWGFINVTENFKCWMFADNGSCLIIVTPLKTLMNY